MTITPIGDKVLARERPRASQVGGILLPESARDSNDARALVEFDVLAVGAKVESLRAGQVVLAHPKAGKPVERDGREYRFIREEDVKARVRS